MSHRLTKLDNGATILTVPQPGALSVSIMILVNTGAKNENEKNSGISHFLEHLAFKGTESRPKSLALSSEFDAIGASYNAFTCHDSTAYYVTVIPEKVEKAVELLSDLYLHPIYPEEEVKKERGVIIEEIKLYEDQPIEAVWGLFPRLAYEGTPAGRLVLGERQTVSTINREDLVSYRAQNYSAQNTTIIAVGNFDEEIMIKLLGSKFSSLLRGEKGTISLIASQQVVSRVKLEKRPIEQSHFVLGFKSVGLFDIKIYPLIVLAGILGGGMSSRLFQKVREELGAAYYIGADQSSHLDHGFFAIYAGVDSIKLELVIKTIIAEIKKVKTEIILPEELNRVKDRLIGNLFLALETPSAQTYFYGEQSLGSQDIVSPQQYADKIRAVNASELKELANEIFQPERLNLAIVGPECSLAEIKSQLEV